jgi:hypothetical protein
LETLARYAFSIGASALLASCAGSQVGPLVPGGNALRSAASKSQTFHYTGAKHIFKVPARVTQITVDARGAAGGGSENGGGGSIGGRGGRVDAIVSVTPGEKLFVFVGGAGSSDGTAGFNGGAAGATLGCPKSLTPNCAGGGGGGASDVRTGGDRLRDRVIVAGGGGAGGWGGGYGGSQYPGDGGKGGGLHGWVSVSDTSAAPAKAARKRGADAVAKAATAFTTATTERPARTGRWVMATPAATQMDTSSRVAAVADRALPYRVRSSFGRGTDGRVRPATVSSSLAGRAFSIRAVTGATRSRRQPLR